jgi:hypothetical protein
VVFGCVTRRHTNYRQQNCVRKKGYPPAQMSPGYNSKLPVPGFDLHQPEPKN